MKSKKRIFTLTVYIVVIALFIIVYIDKKEFFSKKKENISTQSASKSTGQNVSDESSEEVSEKLHYEKNVEGYNTVKLRKSQIYEMNTDVVTSKTSLDEHSRPIREYNVKGVSISRQLIKTMKYRCR